MKKGRDRTDQKQLGKLEQTIGEIGDIVPPPLQRSALPGTAEDPPPQPYSLKTTGCSATSF